jgi:hypothetical protein
VVKNKKKVYYGPYRVPVGERFNQYEDMMKWKFTSTYRNMNIYVPTSGTTVTRCSFFDYTYETSSTLVATALLTHKDLGRFFWMRSPNRAVEGGLIP